MFEVLTTSTRALHQRAAGAGIVQPRELVEHLGHLVAPLAAADEDDDVGGGELGQGLLDHGLAGAEAAGHGDAAAFGDGEEEVEDPLAGDEGPVGGQARGRPAAGARTGQRWARWSGVPSASGPMGSPTLKLPDSSAARLPAAPGGTSTRCSMPGGFGHHAEHVPTRDLGPRLQARFELPDTVGIQGGQAHARLEQIAGDLGQVWQAAVPPHPTPHPAAPDRVRPPGIRRSARRARPDAARWCPRRSARWHVRPRCAPPRPADRGRPPGPVRRGRR